jgi:hypothetical protein
MKFELRIGDGPSLGLYPSVDEARTWASHRKLKDYDVWEFSGDMEYMVLRAKVRNGHNSSAQAGCDLEQPNPPFSDRLQER